MHFLPTAALAGLTGDDSAVFRTLDKKDWGVRIDLAKGTFDGVEIDENGLKKVGELSQVKIKITKSVSEYGFDIKKRIDSMLLEVRESNQTAISLYRSEGFVDDGLRKNYYPPKIVGGEREAALLMSRSLKRC